ncbi:hypothetical protein [Aquimarina sediminis]|uniref:hypothetical protein n=1 Tax=Aquimarina sediminis TaxID=2070536 RepID=UPI000CA01555|nr:hypothetical protein [Aquimarina sediminis]
MFDRGGEDIGPVITEIPQDYAIGDPLMHSSPTVSGVFTSGGDGYFPGIPIINRSNGTISANPESWAESWERGNFIQQTIYGIANSFSIVGQSMNPFDDHVTSLAGEGLNGTDRGGYGAEAAATIITSGIGRGITQGGKTFVQYRAAYWSTRTKPKLEPLINTKTGQVWKQYIELHHRFIPQRWKWAPKWLKNNRLNLQPLNSLEHALKDPYRARFAPKWVKKMFNLKWK